MTNLILNISSDFDNNGRLYFPSNDIKYFKNTKSYKYHPLCLILHNGQFMWYSIFDFIGERFKDLKSNQARLSVVFLNKDTIEKVSSSFIMTTYNESNNSISVYNGTTDNENKIMTYKFGIPSGVHHITISGVSYDTNIMDESEMTTIIEYGKFNYIIIFI